MTTQEIKSNFDAIDAIENPSKYDTQDKYESSSKYNYEHFCACCGRGIKGDPKFGIHAVAPYLIVPFDTDHQSIEEEGIEDMGMYPIGSECKKRYSQEYIGAWQ